MQVARASELVQHLRTVDRFDVIIRDDLRALSKLDWFSPGEGSRLAKVLVERGPVLGDRYHAHVL